MHSNTTDQNTDTLIINNHDVESDDSLLHGEGSVVQKWVKNESDINRHERRSLEKMTIWTILNKLMVRAIKERISEKLEGTGVTVDDLLKTPYEQVEDLNRRLNNANVEDLKLRKLLKLSYIEIRNKMKALVGSISQSDTIPKLYIKQLNDQYIDEYVRLVKDHYSGMVMFLALPINNEGVLLHNDEEFLLPFLPLLQELSFNDHDLVADWQNYNLILNQNSHEAEYDLFNIFGLYYNNNEGMQRSLIERCQFRAACLVNDWEKASASLKHSNDGFIMQVQAGRVKQAMQLALVFNVDISKRLNFLNSLWSRAIVLQDQMMIIDNHLLQEMLTHDNYQSLTMSIISDKLLLVHWILGKANTLGIADKMLIFGVAQAANHNKIEMIDRLLDIAQELSIQNAILPDCIAAITINDHNEVIGLLLNRVQEIDVRNKILRASIALVAARGDNRAVGLLLDRPEVFDIRNQMLLDSIVAAAENGHNGTVELLLNRPGAFDIRNQMLLDSIAVAAENGHNEAVELLLDRPEVLAIRNQMLRTSTVAAAANGYFATVNLLLAIAEELGVTREILQASDYEAFRSAVTNGHFATVNRLLDKAGELNIKHEMLQADNYSAFVNAVRNRDEAIVELLWSNVEDLLEGVEDLPEDEEWLLEPNTLYETLKANNYEVFKLAVQQDRHEIIKLLWRIAGRLMPMVEKEVQFNTISANNYEAFRLASREASYETINLLLGYGKEEDAIDYMLEADDYESLFHIISRFSDDEVIVFLNKAEEYLDKEEVAKSARIRSIARDKLQNCLEVAERSNHDNIRNWMRDLISLVDKSTGRDSKQLEQSEHNPSVKRPNEDAQAGPSGYTAKKQCKGDRKKREVGMLCIDSRDEEEISEEEKKERIKELFDADKIV